MSYKPKAPNAAEWLACVRRIYKAKGFPREEMMRYYRQGMSPLHAMEAAIRRRQKPRRVEIGFGGSETPYKDGFGPLVNKA